tara:strand:+ start:637 stop:957 length:321 start_codon:yes stop_codon:yes gene_type:complete
MQHCRDNSLSTDTKEKESSSCFFGFHSIAKSKKKKNPKTYNSRYSLVVTHPTTNLPITCLSMAERTGCPVFRSLWSYVAANLGFSFINGKQKRILKVKDSSRPRLC